MGKVFYAFLISACVLCLMASAGCKGKVEKVYEDPMLESPLEVTPKGGEADQLITEPVQGQLSTETIPPTAALQETGAQTAAPQEKEARNRDIQRALKAAGFYNGAIDGVIGPKTKIAIKELQRSKGLKADGVVGPKTWAEMEKHLTR